MKMNILSFALFIFDLSVSATAQTSADLQSKYGKSIEAFYVRPNILMTVDYIKGGQIFEAVIESRNTQKKKDGKSSIVETNSEMLPETVSEIIEEIAPTYQRGQKLNGITFNSSCNSLVSEKYENVEIYLTSTCSMKFKGNRIISSARIRWKQKSKWRSFAETVSNL